jgi:hypothetical protein
VGSFLKSPFSNEKGAETSRTNPGVVLAVAVAGFPAFAFRFRTLFVSACSGAFTFLGHHEIRRRWCFRVWG